MEIDAKTVLYRVLEEMGKERIESEVVSSPASIPGMVREILSACTAALRPYDYDKEKIHSDLVVALMHYLLSVCMIQAERKVEYDHDTILDVVIPSVKQLRTDPGRALLLVFPKRLERGSIEEQIRAVRRAQPNAENLWLVFGGYSQAIDSLTAFSRYVPDEFAGGQLRPLSSLIDDIRSFLEAKKIKSFRIFRT